VPFDNDGLPIAPTFDNGAPVQVAVDEQLDGLDDPWISLGDCPNLVRPAMIPCRTWVGSAL